MSLLNYLQFQEIDSSFDDVTDDYRSSDNIVLDDQFDEDSLEHYWDQVVQDIHEDPEWFNFSD